MPSPAFSRLSDAKENASEGEGAQDAPIGFGETILRNSLALWSVALLVGVATSKTLLTKVSISRKNRAFLLVLGAVVNLNDKA
jgi:hypothetical protein